MLEMRVLQLRLKFKPANRKGLLYLSCFGWLVAKRTTLRGLIKTNDDEEKAVPIHVFRRLTSPKVLSSLKLEFQGPSIAALLALLEARKDWVAVKELKLSYHNGYI